MQSGEKSFNVLVISDVGGGTEYLGEDNFIGLAHYINQIPNSEKPNFLIINGGLIPEFPMTGSSRYRDKLLSIKKGGVSNANDAAAIVKPHVERLVNSLPSNATAIYVLGKADFENIKLIEDTLNKEFAYSAESLASRLDSTIEGIRAQRTNIRAYTSSRRSLAEQQASSPGLAREEEIRKTDRKLKAERAILDELTFRKDILQKLYEMSLDKSSKEDIKKMIKNATARQDDIQRQLEDPSTTPQQADALRTESKRQASILKALNYRYEHAINTESTNAMAQRMKQAYTFTKNIVVSKEAVDLIREAALSYYGSTIRDALGRKRDVIVNMEEVALYEKSSGGYEFNLVVSNSMNMSSLSYQKTSNSQMPDRFERLLKNGGILSYDKLLSKPLTLLVSGNNTYTSFSIDPIKDNSEALLAVLSQGPFFDISGIASLWNNRIKTKQTQAFEKGYLDSGASMVKVNPDGTVQFSIISSELLKAERRASDVEELGAATKLITGTKPNSDTEGSTKPGLDLLIASNKRPSELTEKDATILGSGGIMQTIPHHAEGPPQDPRQMKVAVISDVHFGNYSDAKLLQESVKDALARKPDVLIFSGDIIEGNHNNYKYVNRPESEVTFPRDYEKQLIESGISGEELKAKLLESYYSSKSRVISNIDAQARPFMEIAMPLIDDVIMRGGSVIFVSGNHYNKTYSDWQLDESTRLRDMTAVHLMAHEEQGKLDSGWKDRLFAVSGSDYGAESFKIDGIRIATSHKVGPTESAMISFAEKKKSDVELSVGGHFHSFKVVSANGIIVAESPAMQEAKDNPYLKRISIPVGDTTGYMFLDLKVDAEKGKIVAAEISPVFRKDLIKESKGIGPVKVKTA